MMAQSLRCLVQIVRPVGGCISLSRLRVNSRRIVIVMIVVVGIHRTNMLMRRTVKMRHGRAHRPVRKRQDENEQG